MLLITEVENLKTTEPLALEITEQNIPPRTVPVPSTNSLWDVPNERFISSNSNKISIKDIKKEVRSQLLFI